ncbi:MAG: hypothetical protein AB1638_06995 [Nitrospirota bacterium]
MERLKMAAKLIILAAIIVCGLPLGNAYAQNHSSSALLYTYYDVRGLAEGGLGLTDNYFTVTNTTTNWTQAHVRIRTGDKSIELLDFDILLSPKDVFAFDLYLAGNGGIEFASCDKQTLENSLFTTDANGCVVINSVSFPGMLSLIKLCQGLDDAAALLATQKGYVEIIGEGEILPHPSNKNKCASWDGLSTNKNIPFHTLFNITASPNSCLDADIVDMSDVIEGRVYYVTVGTGYVVKRLAYLNAETLDNELPEWSLTDSRRIILHADSYSAEQVRCAADPGCFAYVEARTVNPVDGADDLNLCFYTAAIGLIDVVNRYGAAATFGPTLADLFIRRDGTLPTTGFNLANLESRFTQVITLTDMGYSGFTVRFKDIVDSHYFAVPAPTYSLDMVTKFAFIFPFQHFISESDSLSGIFYDMEENTVAIPLEKFISPGLPTPTTPGEEAQLFTFAAPFVEGWVRFLPLASNATCGNLDTSDDVLCSAPTDTYLPGYTGAVFTVGIDSIGTSLFQYASD